MRVNRYRGSFPPMERVWYSLQPHARGWEVYADGEPFVALRTSEEAHAFAARMALIMWQDHGYLTGVRVLGDDGTWEIELTYGPGPAGQPPGGPGIGG